MSIKTKLKAKQYRFVTSSSDQLNVSFSKDNLKEVTSKQTSSYQLEVISNSKSGVAAQNQLDQDVLIAKALVSSQFGENVSYTYPKPVVNKAVKVFSPQIERMTAKQMISIGQSIIADIKKTNPKILVDVNLHKSVGRSSLEISSGFKDQEPATSFGLSFEGELVSDGDILQIGDYYAWRDLGFNSKQFTKGVIDKFKHSQKVVTIKSGKYPVIFEPDAMVNLLEFVFTSASAINVEQKVSRWIDQLDRQVFDSRVSITDDPTVSFAIDSTSFDDEGVPCLPLEIIKNGVLKNFYTDLRTADKLKMQPNGRGFGIPTDPQLTNIIVSPGKLSSQKIIKNIKKGIIVDQVIGGGQDSPYAGDFSFNIHLGFLIENGEIVGRIKNCLVSGNVFDMLKNQLMEISSDTTWYGGSLSIAPFAFENVNIVGNN